MRPTAESVGIERFRRDVDETDLPSSWRSGARFDKVDDATFEKTKIVLAKGLAKYPSDVIANTLDSIYIVKKIEWDSVEMSGTFGDRCVLVCNDSSNPSWFSNSAVEFIFHNELSGLLFKQHPEHLDVQLWNPTLPVGFQYRGTSFEMVRDSLNLLRVKKDNFDDGFLMWYSTSELAKDFSLIGAHLFMNQSWFWKAARQSRRLGRKVELAISFYSSLSPVFSKEYFQRLPETEPDSQVFVQ
jgi:hypothetical protein